MRLTHAANWCWSAGKYSRVASSPCPGFTPPSAYMLLMPKLAGVVGHVVDAAVAVVREDVREVQARHRDLADGHLQEGAESGIDALLAFGGAETGGRRKVAALHDAAPHEHLRVLLADMV